MSNCSNPSRPPRSSPNPIHRGGKPSYPLFTSSGNEEIDQAARDRRAANQRYFHVAGLSWWPLLTAAALGIIFLLTPYWAITVLLFFGSALWAFAWVPTMTRRKRWMESRGRYYGAVKHIAELETWHEQNP